MLLQSAFISPMFLQSPTEAFRTHVDILARAREILLLDQLNQSLAIDHVHDPSASVREIQLNPQYVISISEE